MKRILLENIWKEKCPGLALACIEASVKVCTENPDLWTEINTRAEELANRMSTEDISQLPAISSSRKAYKACGKDPARYRLSAEALLRRVVSGKGLYQINNVVDQLNLVSISSGFSIGGYDADQIHGDIHFGVGRGDEPYEGIGRGPLNIEFLPVFRDENGAFGTPTSDSERTSVSEKTTRFLMIIINFGIENGMEQVMNEAIRLLETYCWATNIEKTIIRC